MSDTPVAVAAAPAESSAPAESTEKLETAATEVADLSLSDKKDEKKEEVKKDAKKKLKLKVDGEDIEEEVDFDNEEDLTKRFQLAKVAQKRMQETAELKKQLGEFFALMNENPADALSQLGMNPDEFAEKHLARKVEEMKKSPEQLQREKLEQDYEKLKKQMERKDKEAQLAQMKVIQEQYNIELDRDITNALSQSSDLPKSPYVVSRIAALMMAKINAGDTKVKAQDVVPIVKKQIKKELQEMFGAMPEDILESVVGKTNIDRMRKKRIAAAKQGKVDTAKSIKDSGSKSTSDASDAKKSKIAMSKFFKDL